VTLAEGVVRDIASDGREGIFVLVERNNAWYADHLDCAGTVVDTFPFQGVSSAKAFTFLRRVNRFVVLAGTQHPQLFFFDATSEGPALFTLPVGAMRPCFQVTAIGSDARSRVFVAGADGADFGGGAYVLAFDGDGNPAGQVPLDPLDTPADGLDAGHGGLVVAGPRGLRRFAASDSVAARGQELRFSCITPFLEGPDREDARRWLRIEATADLPEDTTLEIKFAATDDPRLRDRLKTIAADTSMPVSHRARRLLSEPDLWSAPIVFGGRARQPDEPAATFSAPLFDVRKRYLLASVALVAGPGARLPVLSQLAVRYPGRSLMESLPAIYQRAEAQPDSFLRKFVGVLEATTQGLDASIGAMGSHVHPSTASARWLDFVARWQGWPWDDALSLEQKRAIASRGARLARDRGTRAGLEALLEAIVPGVPRRFRVTDATGDFGFATVGGATCGGSALPALLGGRTRWSPELDSGAVLGCSRLPCPGAPDDGVWQIAGRVRVEVAASAEQRRAWEPWLLSLIRQMAPLTTRVELRWVGANALRSDRLDGTLTLEEPPAPHLGTDAVTGLARLPEGRARLSPSGSDIGTRIG
jgi:phage tail-like protein